MHSRNFLIVARPRSRTSWLSTFLNADGVVCQHDLIDRCVDLDDYRRALRGSGGIAGAVDTGAVFFLDQILEGIPECRVVTIDRPGYECEESLAVAGVKADLTPYDSYIEAAKRVPQSIWFEYNSLDDEGALRLLWSHVAGKPFPQRWYDHVRHMAIEPTKDSLGHGLARGTRDPDYLRGWLQILH